MNIRNTLAITWVLLGTLLSQQPSHKNYRVPQSIAEPSAMESMAIGGGF